MEQQNESDYTEQLYEEVIGYKREYKQNLIRSRDGFGRIFEVVQRLAVTEPTRIYGEAVHVIEDILNSDSVAIYSLSEDNPWYARLEVSSGKLTGHLRKSIHLTDYPEIIDSISSGKVWIKNIFEQ